MKEIRRQINQTNYYFQKANPPTCNKTQEKPFAHIYSSIDIKLREALRFVSRGDKVNREDWNVSKAIDTEWKINHWHISKTDCINVALKYKLVYLFKRTNIASN